MLCFHAAQTGKHLLRTQNVSEQNQKHFLCPRHKICVRNKCCARGQTGKHLCRQQCVLVCQYLKAPAKRSQHANATYRNIVGRNMLGAFGQRVAMCCDMLGVVGSRLKMVKFVPTTRNMSQHRGQTSATCCAQQCCDMLRWHVAIVWPGLNVVVLQRTAKKCTKNYNARAKPLEPLTTTTPPAEDDS